MSSPFRTSFSENIFRQKYAHSEHDSWGALAQRLVDDVCGSFQGKAKPLLTKDERDTLEQYVFNMKFIPGGRYLYYAGRPLHAWNNCLAGHHKVLTDKGMVRLDLLADGEQIKVYSPISHQYEMATAKSHGVQPVQEIIFENLRGKSKKQWAVVATRNHHWPLVDDRDTYDIRVGDVVPAACTMIEPNLLAFVHGLVFADGTLHRQTAAGMFEHQMRLCGKKSALLDKLAFLGDKVTITYPPFAKGDPCVYFPDFPFNMKELPESDDPSYIVGFIKGWLAGDGAKTVNQIHSINKEAIEWFTRNAHIANLVVTGDILVETRPSNFGERQPLYRVNYSTCDDFPGFKVVAINQLGEQPVYCPFEPKFNRIVIDHGIDTYQCYLLGAEQDTREEWGRLIHAASDCLMSGGGIGICYTPLRGKGFKLSRTGGLSSGPIPLMYAVNEYGRNVMQGGSRRSAIYASLHWWHKDIQDFLVAKNWHNLPVGKATKRGGAPFTLRDAKIDDFNFPAPLDMTNISVNYDDKFLSELEKGLPEVYLHNVYQALSSAEPGLSFNFGKREKEVLRNACCEVTSADDSDVCNLGSINMGAVKDIDEFREIVALASKFLACGTIRAELPYEKVYRVRDKNRRLGLGLMGIHEWLLKRGYKYEVVPELHEWLKVYRYHSTRAANEFCDAKGISRPVAYRAIAPTGTIGILAGTTTGIEPMIYVAYKRRYLSEGVRWKYEYVVDSTADYLIKQYGLKPEEIETSASLAGDPERRVRFQADVQDYVDMAISSTINLPAWGSDLNNEDKVIPFAKMLAKYATRLRGFTCYPDGSRGGQPITEVPYEDALKHKGVVFEESDVCELTGKGGTCGI